MLKKMIAVIGTVVALAALSPAVASAVWKMNKVAITKNEGLQLKGQVSLESEANSGIKCPIVANATLESGTTTGKTQFAVDGVPTTVCATQGNLLALGCTVETVQVTGLEWVLHRLSTQAITLTTGQIHATLIKHDKNPCPTPTVTVEAGTVFIQIEVAEMDAIKLGFLSGGLESSLGPLSVGGSVNFTPAGTFGL